MGWATVGSPSPLPSPSGRGRGRMVHSLSITAVSKSAQGPSAKQQSVACCSLSLRERVRVRGKYLGEYAKGVISKGTSFFEPAFGAIHGFLPAPLEFGHLHAIQHGTKLLVFLPLVLDFVRVLPKPDRQPCQVRRTKSGRLAHLGPDQRHTDQVRLKLHQQIINR